MRNWMKKTFRSLLLLALSLMLYALAACGDDDDDYYYPSVKLEFLTAYSGSDGRLNTVLTDEGTHYAVVQDDSDSRITADSLVRIVSNYETLRAEDGTTGVRLYALSGAIAPLPRKAETFKEGVKSEPAEVLSIWMGRDYLNMVLTVKQQGKHAIAFVEESISTDSDLRTNVHLSLYHDVTSTTQDYTKRAYLSIPLQQYADNGTTPLRIHFTLNTQSGEQKTYSFDYSPSNPYTEQ